MAPMAFQIQMQHHQMNLVIGHAKCISTFPPVGLKHFPILHKIELIAAADNEDINLYVDGTSELTSRRIQTHLHTCLETHPNCGTKEPPILPRRALDINEMRLHVSLPHERAHYTALSYCWGGPQPFKTTTETYPAFLKEISLKAMPKTLRDAVKVTRQLGFRYLWIDALCIIQDDEIDVASEIDTMMAIYKNATVVIVAEASSSVQQGFLEQKLPDSAIKLPVNDEDSNVRGYIWLVDDDPRKEVALSTRAWVFQEFLLARRLLIYTRHGVIWSCRSDKENGDALGPHAQNWLWRKYRTARESLSTERSLTYQVSNATPSYYWRQLWNRIASAYAPLGLSLVQDKLPAMAGIAKEFQARIKENYLAGLWENDLVLQLAWWRDNEAQHTRVELSKINVPVEPGKGKVPSWSWASVTGQVTFMDTRSYEQETALQVLSCRVEPLYKESSFGRVKTGYLEVDAFAFPIRPLDWNEYSGVHAQMDHDGSRFRGYDYTGNCQGLFLGVSPLGPGYGGGWQALFIEPLDDGTYQRVGCLRGDGSNKPDLSGMRRQRLVIV